MTTQGHDDFLGASMGVRSIPITLTGSRSPCMPPVPARQLQTELTYFFNVEHKEVLRDEEGSTWWSFKQVTAPTSLQQVGSPGSEPDPLTTGQVLLQVQGVPPTIAVVQVAPDVAPLDTEVLRTILRLADATHGSPARVVCHGLTDSATVDSSGLEGRQLVSVESVPVTSLSQLRQAIDALPHECQQVRLFFRDPESAQATAGEALYAMDDSCGSNAQSP